MAIRSSSFRLERRSVKYQASVWRRVCYRRYHLVLIVSFFATLLSAVFCFVARCCCLWSCYWGVVSSFLPWCCSVLSCFCCCWFVFSVTWLFSSSILSCEFTCRRSMWLLPSICCFHVKMGMFYRFVCWSHFLLSVTLVGVILGVVCSFFQLVQLFRSGVVFLFLLLFVFVALACDILLFSGSEPVLELIECESLYSCLEWRIFIFV